VSAAIELFDFAWARRSRFSVADVRDGLLALRSYRADYPIAYTRVLAQRRGKHGKRSPHWSGKSRTAIEQELAPRSHVYKALSWETHGILVPLQNIRFDSTDVGTNLRFGSPFETSSNQDEEAEWRAYTVGGMIYHLWNEIAEHFDLEVVALPDLQPDATRRPTPR